ncbi:trypsin-like peptidase domain-containing protein [Rhodanobacter sp. 7MK24]|uniref:S1 family peptidase n=1 Tax=Rhodanobacter sp. 7MK24 TaxID=2775922 RepID=UPI00177FA3D4|nr:serine protease [Rhodanobacter sp. 7MK24]MBD8880129.1 trypsin-like peptidase domain-containing protein [Rhodanobacter sp. 7MK24]
MRTWCEWTIRLLGRIGMLMLVSGIGATTVQAASLDAALLPKIQAATFEVVQAKPVNDPLTYEKPLPLDLLPYQERTDKYYSIGTAFAIGHGRYVTAGHVLMVGMNSLWGPPELRDGAGHVYPIAKIEKFSLRQDFVVFTLAQQPAGDAALEIDRTPALNQVVYAVGNALGTGVVIRDGLYTSDTPEEQDGAWKWMRFSAAASPGNSGGPLLDQDGKVIGVVLMKSANENLNYALPIRDVQDAPDGKAVIDTRTGYQIDLFDTVQNDEFKTQFALPESLGDFYRDYQTRFDANEDKQQKALLDRESANLFPNGAGSARLLHEQTTFSGFPSLIVRGSDGQWGRTDTQSRYFELDSKGYVRVGGAGHNGLVHIRRPDGLDAAKFYGDAKTRMDLLARAGLFQRSVGSEKIKITSLGKPTLEATHVDRWQRPWRIAVWPLPYANTLVATYTLPTPNGCVMLVRFVPPAGLHDTRLDFDELSSFVYLTYEGTLAQWKDFLGNPALQPAAFRNIHIDYGYGQRFSYASQRVAFSYPSSLQSIGPDNLLWLGLRFFTDGKAPTWDVGDVEVWKDTASDDHDRVNVQRFIAPPDGLDDDMTSRWKKLSERQYPYNAVASSQDDLMKIVTVITPTAVDKQPPTVLYSALYGTAGTQSQDFMKGKLDLLTKDLQVTEH